MPLNNSLYQNDNSYSFSKANEFSDFSYKMPSKLCADRENNHLKISKEIPQNQKNSSSKTKKKDVLKDIDKWIIDERKKIEQLKYCTKEMNSSKKKKNSVKSLSRSKSARSTQLQLQMINDIHTKVEKLNKIFNKKKNLKIDNYDKPNPSCLKSLKTKSKSRSNSKSKEKKYKYPKN